MGLFKKRRKVEHASERTQPTAEQLRMMREVMADVLRPEEHSRMGDPLWKEVARLHADAEAGMTEQREAARAALVGIGEDAVEPLLHGCWSRGLLSGVDAMLAVSPEVAVRLTYGVIMSLSSTMAVFGTHVLGHLAVAGAPGALDGLRAAAPHGERRSHDGAHHVAHAVGDVADLWLVNRFAEANADDALRRDGTGRRMRMWHDQGRPIAGWPSCCDCGAAFPAERPFLRGVQCEACGMVFAEPTYEPQISHEEGSQGRMVGLRNWRPLHWGELGCWGLAKMWVVTPAAYLDRAPDSIIAYAALAADGDD